MQPKKNAAEVVLLKRREQLQTLKEKRVAAERKEAFKENKKRFSMKPPSMYASTYGKQRTLEKELRKRAAELTTASTPETTLIRN